MRVRVLVTALIAGAGCVVLAQDSGPPDAAPAPAPAPEKKPEPEKKAQPQPLPGLDELLGIPKKDKEKEGEKKEGEGKEAPKSEEKAKEPEKASEPELQRRLTGREMTETFSQAVTLMGDTAERLLRSGDTGLDTQRIQEEIIRRLDTLIESAREQQQQQQQSSSSSSSSSQSQPQQQQRQEQGQQTGNENQGEATPPGMKTGQLRESLEAARASWGALPARVRDALLQGSGEKYSSLYEALTEEYYRRLAEEGPRP